MATTFRASGPTAANGPPGRADELRVDPPGGQARRPRLSWVAAGLVVVLAGGLFGAVALARVADRTPVLALAEAIERGETLTAEHLRAVNVAADEPLGLIAAGQRSELVGQAATTSLPAGTLVSREQFTDGPLLEAGWAVVGLALQPGEYPTGALAAGDRVEVVRTPPPAGARSDAATAVAVLTDAGEVFAVERVTETSAALMVSLAVPREVAPAVAAAAAEGRVRLVLVPPP